MAVRGYIGPINCPFCPSDPMFQDDNIDSEFNTDRRPYRRRFRVRRRCQFCGFLATFATDWEEIPQD